MSVATIEEMAERLGRLECRCAGLEGHLRWWRRGGLLALALVALVIAGGAVRDTQRATVVQKLVLVDKAGKERATLEVDQDGLAAFHLKDAEGRTRLSLDVGAGGDGYVSLLDEEGAPHCGLSQTEDAWPYVFLNDKHGRTHIDIGVVGEAKWGFSLRDSDDKHVASMAIDGEFNPFVELKGKGDRILFRAPEK